MSMRKNYQIKEDELGKYVVFVSPQGEEALVDYDDVIRLDLFNKTLKVFRRPRTKYLGIQWGGRKNKAEDMAHRLILDAPLGKDVDHIDHNGLNNRKYNIRVVSRQENIRRQRPRLKKYSSKFRGVYWSKQYNKWIVEIRISREKRKYIGGFINEKEAAKAYNNAAIKYFGKFAYINNMDNY